MTNAERAGAIAQQIADHDWFEGRYNEHLNVTAITKRLAAAFAEVKRVTRDSILREAANVADTSTFKNRGDAIRALIDTPTEPPAPDPTKALVEVLREVESFLSDPRIGTVNYMESPLFYTDCDATLDKIRTALRLVEDGG